MADRDVLDVSGGPVFYLGRRDRNSPVLIHVVFGVPAAA
jgi:hypothetical protein